MSVGAWWWLLPPPQLPQTSSLSLFRRAAGRELADLWKTLHRTGKKEQGEMVFGGDDAEVS